jgi:hypothetical protein
MKTADVPMKTKHKYRLRVDPSRQIIYLEKKKWWSWTYVKMWAYDDNLKYLPEWSKEAQLEIAKKVLKDCNNGEEIYV